MLLENNEGRAARFFWLLTLFQTTSCHFLQKLSDWKNKKTIRTPQTYLAYMYTAYVFMVKCLWATKTSPQFFNIFVMQKIALKQLQTSKSDPIPAFSDWCLQQQHTFTFSSNNLCPTRVVFSILLERLFISKAILIEVCCSHAVQITRRILSGATFSVQLSKHILIQELIYHSFSKENQ